VTVEIPVTVTGEGGAQTAGAAQVAAEVTDAEAAAAEAPADVPSEESGDTEQA
jgi:hypothetical protein